MLVHPLFSAERQVTFLDLKGLPEPLATCEVVWAPEPDRPLFPPPSGLAVEASRPFVSRSTELEVAEGVLADPARDRLAGLWLLGEPGIGKTRLATEIAHRVDAAGGVVLFGRCSEDLSVLTSPSSAEPSRALLICTARNTSPDDNEALASLVDELGRRGVPSHHLELTGLDTEAVGELVSSAAGRPLDERLSALVTSSTPTRRGTRSLSTQSVQRVPPQSQHSAGGNDSGALIRIAGGRRTEGVQLCALRALCWPFPLDGDRQPAFRAG